MTLRQEGNAGGRMDFARWKFQPKSASSDLQALQSTDPGTAKHNTRTTACPDVGGKMCPDVGLAERPESTPCSPKGASHYGQDIKDTANDHLVQTPLAACLY